MVSNETRQEILNKFKEWGTVYTHFKQIITFALYFEYVRLFRIFQITIAPL